MKRKKTKTKKAESRDWAHIASLFLDSGMRTRRVVMGSANAAKVAAYRLRRRHRRDGVLVNAEGTEVVFRRKEI